MRTKSGTTVRLLIGASAGLLALLASTGCSSSSGSGSSGGSGGGGAAGSGASVTIKEKMGPPDAYSFDPASVTVSSGSSLTISNKSDEDHTITCTPDAGVNVKVEKAGSGTATFSKAGTYSCASTEHPDAKLSVTVS